MAAAGAEVKNVLITGCSSGVGLAAAVQFAQKGYKTYATMRNTAKADDLNKAAADAGVEVIVKALDVTKTDTIKACVDEILAADGHIDVLVNNAGAGMPKTVEDTTEEEAAWCMDLNFMGCLRTTKAVVPGMRERKSGRIIFVTSVGGLLGSVFNDVYCAAKFAVEGMAESMAPLLAMYGVHVSCVEAGPINTSFVASAREKLGATEGKEEEPAGPYDHYFKKYMAATGEVFKTYGQTGAQVAEFCVKAATDETPNLRYVTAPFVEMFVKTKYVDPTGNSILEAGKARIKD